MKFLLGIDDAGRGPVVGSMFLAGVLITKEQERILKSKNIKDSKMLSHSSRIMLSGLIKENSIDCEIIEVTPKEIDKAVELNHLNVLEAQKMAEIIAKIVSRNNEKDIEIVLDCPSVNTKEWKNKLLSFLEKNRKLKIKCEHKADINYISVAAASILAKVARENSIKSIKQKIAKDFGSGYPADPKTREFLLSYGKKFLNLGIIRESWSTWKEISKTKQKRLF